MSLNRSNVFGLYVVGLSSEYRMAQLDEHLDHRKGDVWVVTYPKCGTTFIQRVLQVMVYDRESDPRHNKHYAAAAPWVEVNPAAFTRSVTLEEDRLACDEQIEGYRALPSPRVFKSHFYPLGHMRSNGLSKFVNVVRNPFDTVVSYYHHCLGFLFYNFNGSFDDFFEIWMSGNMELNDYWGFQQQWFDRSARAADTIVLFYEDVLRDKPGEFTRLASFLNITLTPSQLEYIIHESNFDELKKTSMQTDKRVMTNIRRADGPSFFRKGEIGDYVNYFTREQYTRLYKRWKYRFATNPVLLSKWDDICPHPSKVRLARDESKL